MIGASPLLDVRRLTIRLPAADAVRDLGFHVHAGETLAIVGESGSGKSLTALALMGLLPARARIVSGAALFDGEELFALPERALRALRGRRIAMIFQEPMSSLNPVLTIGRQIAEVLQEHEGLTSRAARARAIDLLDLVRIADPHRRVDDYPHRLSGGMRQRVMIAMAVACRPRLLIADEPTTALDVTVQAQILALLDRLRRELSTALVLITHDLGVVGQWADRVVVMYAGRKVEEAPAEALLSAPRHPYTRGLLASALSMDHSHHYRKGRLGEIPGAIASAQGERGCAFAPRCPLVAPACRATVPPLIEAAPGHASACPIMILQEPAHALVGD